MAHCTVVNKDALVITDRNIVPAWRVEAGDVFYDSKGPARVLSVKPLGTSKAVVIRLRSGVREIVPADSYVRMAGRNHGARVWQRARMIERGFYLVSSGGCPGPEIKRPHVDGLTYEEAFILGMFITAGFLRGPVAEFHVHPRARQALEKLEERLILRFAPDKARLMDGGDAVLQCVDPAVSGWLRDYTDDGKLRRVPPQVLQSDYAAQAGFLSGVVNGRGFTVTDVPDSDPSVVLRGRSSEMAQDMFVMLRAQGVPCLVVKRAAHVYGTWAVKLLKIDPFEYPASDLDVVLGHTKDADVTKARSNGRADVTSIDLVQDIQCVRIEVDRPADLPYGGLVSVCL